MTRRDDATVSPEDRRMKAEEALGEQVLKRLHEALKASGMTQADLAKALEVRRSAVNQVFRGDGNMHIARLAAYLDALGFELELKMKPVDGARAQGGDPIREDHRLPAPPAGKQSPIAIDPSTPESREAPVGRRQHTGLAARGVLPSES
jgi:transcriptional regulator with XRE-family HTH domain